MNIKVDEGSVHINDIWVLAEHDDVIVLQADLKEKHAEIWGYSDNEVLLCDSKNVEADGITNIIISNLGFNIETLFAEVTKYSLFLTLVKSSEGKKVWSNDNR